MSGVSAPESSRSSVVLPAPLSPSTTTREPRSTASETSVNTSSDPYDLDSPSAVSGVRPAGAGVGNRTRATRSRARAPSVPASSRSARLAICWAAVALVALARILSAWASSAPAFFSALARSRLRRRSSCSRGLQVFLPADVVDVGLGPVGVQVPDLVDDLVEQLDVVADHHDAALVRAQEVAQPGDRVGVEVVGRLVEQQRGRVGEQDPGQLDPAPLAAGQRAQRLVEHPVGQAEVGADPGGLGLGRVAAERGEAVLQPAVPAHDRVLGRVVGGLGQLDLGLLQLVQQGVQPAGGQHPVAGEHGEIAGARILRQVADLAAPVDAAVVRQRLAGQHAQGAGLAGAVAADQPDAVAGLDAQGRAGQQDAGAGTQLQGGCGDHGDALPGSSGRGQCGDWPGQDT